MTIDKGPQFVILNDSEGSKKCRFKALLTMVYNHLSIKVRKKYGRYFSSGRQYRDGNTPV